MSGRKRNKVKNKQINKNRSTLVRIDEALHYELKIIAAKERTKIKVLIEKALIEFLELKDD